MQAANVPCTGRRYWFAIFAASVFGVNLGDFIARNLHAGHWAALPVLLVVFVGVLAMERRSRAGVEVYYWLGVVIVRAVATQLSDLATHDYDVDYQTVIPALLPLLILLVAFGRPAGPVPVGVGAVAGPLANPMYWAALMVAEIIGTAFGDAIPDLLRLRPWQEYLVFAGLMVGTFALRTDRRFQSQSFYWVTIVVIAAAGLSAGDAIAHAGRLWLSTVLTGVVFAGVLVLWPRDRPILDAPMVST